MNRDNDIVRGLGFVALYAAYLEESIDQVMERLSLIKEVTDKERKFPTSQKITWCTTALRSLDSGELDDLIGSLGEATVLLEKRNEVIHGRIYAGNDRSSGLKSGRPGVPNRDVTSDELYDLAEEIFDVQAVVPNLKYFATMRAIAAKINA